MTLLDTMKGQVVLFMTDAKVEVELTIESVTEGSTTIEITPSTKENDWWGESETITHFLVKFTNGFVHKYPSLTSIKLK